MVRDGGDAPTWDPACPGPRCKGGRLDIFQPGPERPELVLGYCWHCGELYRLGPDPDGGGWRVDEAARLVAVGTRAGGARKTPGEPIAGGTN